MMGNISIISTWKEIFDAFFVEKNFSKGCASLFFRVSVVVFLTLSLGAFHIQRCFDFSVENGA